MRLDKLASNCSQKLIEDFKKEANILKGLPKHNNLIRFIDFIEEDKWCYLIMELASGGNLDQFIKNRKGERINEAHILYIFK